MLRPLPLTALLLVSALLVAATPTAATAQGSKPPPLDAGPAPQPTRPTPAVTLGPVVGGRERIVVAPATVGVGQRVAITLENFPPPNGDMLRVVPVGAPDNDDNRALFQQNIYAAVTQPIQAGPFAPGTYEVRYLTMNYNNERRYEVSARALFTVER